MMRRRPAGTSRPRSPGRSRSATSLDAAASCRGGCPAYGIVSATPITPARTPNNERPESLQWTDPSTITSSPTTRSGLARYALERLAATTQPADTDWGLGIGARSRALLSEGAAADALYREAIHRLGRAAATREPARTCSMEAGGSQSPSPKEFRMKLHGNAALSLNGRRRMVALVVEQDSRSRRLPRRPERNRRTRYAALADASASTPGPVEAAHGHDHHDRWHGDLL